MKTYCPSCQTVFRITAEQLRLRVGKVRCGQCHHVFNALDRLLDDSESVVIPAPVDKPVTVAPARVTTPPTVIKEEPRSATHSPKTDPLPDTEQALPSARHWLSAWLASSALPAEHTLSKAFAATAMVLALLLAGQALFHFRSALAVAAPALRPVLIRMSEFLGAELPLPRDADLISIESSDLQSEPGKNRLLVLQATLRNSARYAQDYPALELSLTDTKDKTVVRRVFLPGEYLPPKMPPDGAFAANSEIEVRLWLEAKEISAAGYRLYAFYP